VSSRTGAPLAGVWGNTGHLVTRDATESRLCPKQRPSPTNEFCRTPLVLARLKLARNQRFAAVFVPNMYLFGTFSAQNTPEIAP
jgi:hypothetical protein